MVDGPVGDEETAPPTIASADLHAGSTPARRTSLSEVLVDGEAILYDTTTKGLHRLNRQATLVWQCLDGTSTLTEIADDIAAACGADPTAVLADVVDAARDMGWRHLLDGVTGDPDVASGADGVPVSPGAAAWDAPGCCSGGPFSGF